MQYKGNGSSTTQTMFKPTLWEQDASVLTPDTAFDSQGIAAYLPNDDGMTTDQLDPQTGLPVFTAAKLKRANELGGRGLHGFLRPVLEIEDGYKRVVGKIMYPERYTRLDLQQKREQFNAARIADGRGGCMEPVIFNESEFMY